MKHLFIDSQLIESMDMCALEINQPDKIGIIEQVNKTNVNDLGAYGTVIDDGIMAKMWSAAWNTGKKSAVEVSYSLDGLTWYSPEFQKYRIGKRRVNNVVIDVSPEGSVFIDPNDRAFPYKYVYHTDDIGLQIIKSPDGIDWIMPPVVLDSGHRDTQNTFFWDTRIGKYVGYMRGWIEPSAVQDREEKRLRCIERVEFNSFGQLVPSKKRVGRAVDAAALVMQPDEYDMPEVDLYNNAVVQYENDVYLAFPSLYRHLQIGKGYDYRELPNEGLMEVQMAVSRDGIEWDRFRQPYFQLGAYGDHDNCVVYMLTGFIQRGNYIYQYYRGTDYTHRKNDVFSARGDEYYDTYILKQRVDGFLSLNNYDLRPAKVRTKPIQWSGYLTINFDAAASGYIRARIFDIEGTLVGTQKIPLMGNWLLKQIEFDADLLKFINKKVQIEFEFRNCKLYGFGI